MAASLHSDTENSFNLPFLMALHCFLSYSRPASYIYSSWVLHVNCVLNCPTNVVQVLAFWLRLTMQVLYDSTLVIPNRLVDSISSSETSGCIWSLKR